MAHRLTITAADMREINRSAILEIIRRESVISRSAIAKRLNVSLPTVMRIVDELVEDGIVKPHGETEWSGGRRCGLTPQEKDARLFAFLILRGNDLILTPDPQFTLEASDTLVVVGEKRRLAEFSALP